MQTVFPKGRILFYLALFATAVLFLVATTIRGSDYSKPSGAIARDVWQRKEHAREHEPAEVDNVDVGDVVEAPAPVKQVNSAENHHSAPVDDQEVQNNKAEDHSEQVKQVNVIEPPNSEPGDVAKPVDNGTDEDEEKKVIDPPLVTDAQKREKIREMAKFAWDSYRKIGWGANEIRPISKTTHSQDIFGGDQMAAFIVDSADTLYIMGLTEEFQQAEDFIRDKWSIKNAAATLSVFETTIRFIGGLLSLFALTGKEFYKTKAALVADVMMSAFDTKTGIPKSLVDVRSNTSRNYGWAAGGSSILSEFGSLHLEYEYLAQITKNSIYAEKVRNIRNVLDKMEKPNGLYPNYMNPAQGTFTSTHVSLGAMGDSFYEYLIKSYILTNKTDEQSIRMYLATSDAIQKKMVFTSEKSKLVYVAELRTPKIIEHKMGHLACFVPGMFALEYTVETNATRKAQVLKLAEDLANTCHESYIRSESHIGPEMFYFNSKDEATARNAEKSYILRPEVLEGFFYLWRITGNQKYKDWVWDAVQAFEKYCRTENGYVGLRDVYNPTTGGFDDVQQTFFLAETLKYAYLTFDDESIPFNKWVFNTEAHPLPIWQPGS